MNSNRMILKLVLKNQFKSVILKNFTYLLTNFIKQY